MLSYILVSIAGTFALYFTVHLVIPKFCPKPPEKLLVLKREVDRATASGDWYDDSDIHMLDRAMLEAEKEKPGSTLLLYFTHFKTLMAMGSAIISFIANGWIMDIFRPMFFTILCLTLGLSFLFSPFFYWFISRPLKNK